jgi:hypothetical protein
MTETRHSVVRRSSTRCSVVGPSVVVQFVNVRMAFVLAIRLVGNAPPGRDSRRQCIDRQTTTTCEWISSSCRSEAVCAVNLIVGCTLGPELFLRVKVIHSTIFVPIMSDETLQKHILAIVRAAIEDLDSGRWWRHSRLACHLACKNRDCIHRLRVWMGRISPIVESLRNHTRSILDGEARWVKTIDQARDQLLVYEYATKQFNETVCRTEMAWRIQACEFIAATIKGVKPQIDICRRFGFAFVLTPAGCEATPVEELANYAVKYWRRNIGAGSDKSGVYPDLRPMCWRRRVRCAATIFVCAKRAEGRGTMNGDAVLGGLSEDILCMLGMRKEYINTPCPTNVDAYLRTKFITAECKRRSVSPQPRDADVVVSMSVEGPRLDQEQKKNKRHHNGQRMSEVVVQPLDQDDSMTDTVK